MPGSRQREYLDAMGIDTWVLREPQAAVVPEAEAAVVVAQPPEPPAETVTETVVAAPAGAPGLKLGPGQGGVLLVCAQDSDSASKLANDIGRTLGSVPVWSWPDHESPAISLPDAVEENLFTTVAIFGAELSRQFFAAGMPDNLHSANVVQLPAIEDIRDQAEARRQLWAALCRSGMISGG